MKKSIFDIVVPEQKLHDKFKLLNDDPQFVAQKKILDEWGRLFHDRDGKLVEEFQTTFHSSFWEMYLSTVFKNMKFNINNSKNRPDFIIDEPEKFYIEAVVSNIKKEGFKEKNFMKIVSLANEVV